MATVKDVMGYLKPLLDRSADLALVGRLIVVKPVRHILRGVLVDRTSSANDVKPRWFVHHLFSPHPKFHMSCGDDLYRRSYGPWDTTLPDTPRVLCDEIESVALPKLRAIADLNDYLTAVSQHWAEHPPAPPAKRGKGID